MSLKAKLSEGQIRWSENCRSRRPEIPVNAGWWRAAHLSEEGCGTQTKAGKTRAQTKFRPYQEPVVSAALDVYERHRESLSEWLLDWKVRPIWLFFDDVPPDYDENYDFDDDGGGGGGSDVDKEKKRTPSMDVETRNSSQ
jgi:hypothetical protein